MSGAAIKVIVRRLPASLSSEQFIELCKTHCSSSWNGAQLLYYVGGRTKGRKSIYARAYLSFTTLHLAHAFLDQWTRTVKIWMEVRKRKREREEEEEEGKGFKCGGLCV